MYPSTAPCVNLEKNDNKIFFLCVVIVEWLIFENAQPTYKVHLRGNYELP